MRDEALQDDRRCAVLRLHGSLNLSSLASFRQRIEVCVARQPEVRCLTIDLSELETIDAAGLAMLLIARDTVERLSWVIELRGAQGSVAAVLLLARFDVLFRLLPAAEMHAGEPEQIEAL